MGLIGSSPKDPIVVRSHKLYQIRLWSHYRGWSQLVCSIPTLGSAREQAAAQEGAEGLAGVGFLLALTEALGELSAGPLTAFHEQPVRVTPRIRAPGGWIPEMWRWRREP